MRSSFNAGWAVRPKQNPFSELTGAKSAPEPVTLPHDAMIGTERDPSASHDIAYFPGGVWEYTKRFDAPDEWRDRRVSLQFEGVYRDAMVYVNDDFAASEPNGYSEFIVDLDPFLRYGEENTIKVDCRAGEDSRWYSGAGIYRPVHLWVQNPVHLAIDGVWMTTPEIDDHGAVVEVAAEVQNDTAHTVTVRMACELRDPAGETVASGDIPVTLRPLSTAIGRQRLAVSEPARWSADQPHLYSCTTTLAESDDESAELDRDVTAFGIRSLQLDPAHGLRINGETVKLRGACVHHDNGPIGAATISRAEERRVEMLKAAGFNALRSAHNPMSRAMLDACDRLGVIVMDETWDMWTENKVNHDFALRFEERWRTDVATLVRKDRNHPSVVLYSTGNEIPDVGSPLGAARARDIAEHVRSLDPHRYVTTGVQPMLAIRGLIAKIPEILGFVESPDSSDVGEPPPTEEAEPQGVNTQMAMWAMVKDQIMQSPIIAEGIEEVSASLDVVGYNYVSNRYLLDHELYPNRVIVGSETNVTDLGQDWPVISTHPHLIGDFTWTGWDYLGEVGIGRVGYDDEDPVDRGVPGVVAPFPWLVAHTGDIHITGVRRPASYYREIVFGLRREPFIAVQRPENAHKQIAYSGPWSWSDTVDSWSWDGHEGTAVDVDVYSADDEVELVLNGESLGRQPVEEFRTKFAVAYEPGELVAIAYADGEESARAVLRTASGPVQLVAEADRTEIAANDSDLAYVAVRLVDDSGIVNSTANQPVEVTVEGPGMVQGFASADHQSTEPFGSPTCSTYDGQALAVIRPTGPGVVELTFTADGLDPATCRLTVSEG